MKYAVRRIGKIFIAFCSTRDLRTHEVRWFQSVLFLRSYILFHWDNSRIKMEENISDYSGQWFLGNAFFSTNAERSGFRDHNFECLFLTGIHGYKNVYMSRS